LNGPSGDLAYDMGSWKLILRAASGNVEERGKSAIIWREPDGEWKAVVITFSSDAPPAGGEPSEPAEAWWHVGAEGRASRESRGIGTNG